LVICTPVTVAVTTLLRIYLDIDPYEEGIDEEDLGLAGFSVEEIKKHANTGEAAGSKVKQNLLKNEVVLEL